MPDAVGKLYCNEPNTVRWDGLRDDQTGQFINDASLTFAFQAANSDGTYNSGGASVANGSGSLSFDTGPRSGPGNYVGTVAANAAFTPGSPYTCVMTATASGGGTIGKRYIPYTAALQGSRN